MKGMVWGSGLSLLFWRKEVNALTDGARYVNFSLTVSTHGLGFRVWDLMGTHVANAC